MRLGAVGAPLVLGALIAYMGTLVAAYRYFFPYFMGDNGWYLQVAWRVAQGAALYRDVLWAYGPLPIQVLAGLFRWVAAEAWLANLLSGLFAMLACLLSYFVMRTLVSRRAALVISAFTVLVGPFVLGDLTRAYLFAYTQPIVWGALFSLAALAAALAWQQAPHPLALVGTGILCGIALLSKPEYGLAAVGSVAVVLLRERAGRGAWVGWGLGVALCVLGDGAWVAREAGWAALVRGYRGYDQLASRALWGTRPGLTTPLTWFVGMHALWASGLALLLGKRRAALRPWAYAVALGAALLGAALVLLFIFPDGARQTLATLLARRWGAVHVDFSRLLPLLVALPWGPLLALLLLVGWLAWRMPEVPVAFWGIWSLSFLINLRWVMLGFASPYAFGPALALLWWVGCHHLPALRSRGGQRLVLLFLLLLTGLHRASFTLLDHSYINVPPRSYDTRLGPVRVPYTGKEFYSLQAFIKAHSAPDDPIFVIGWGAAWYLLADRPNITALDVMLAGLGTTEPEASQLRSQLERAPPTIVLVPEFILEEPDPHAWANFGYDRVAIRAALSWWWPTLERDYEVQDVAGASGWVAFLRREPSPAIGGEGAP